MMRSFFEKLDLTVARKSLFCFPPYMNGMFILPGARPREYSEIVRTSNNFHPLDMSLCASAGRICAISRLADRKIRSSRWRRKRRIGLAKRETERGAVAMELTDVQGKSFNKDVELGAS